MARGEYSMEPGSAEFSQHPTRHVEPRGAGAAGGEAVGSSVPPRHRQQGLPGNTQQL